MPYFSDRRSPSLESLGSVASMLSSGDENGPGASTQSRDRASAFGYIHEEQKDWLQEREGMSLAALTREHEQPNMGLPPPADVYPMHKHFYFPTENIYFLVDGVLYSVHRYFFERDSSSFAGRGLSRQEPMILANISTQDFDLFLSILYPSSFGVYTASTVEDWSSILQLADQWSFESIKALAVCNLGPIASPIDKIVLGRRHGVNDWLKSAYTAVCLQEGPLSLQEGRRLGVDDVIRINAIRYYHIPDLRPPIIPLSDACIEDAFELHAEKVQQGVENDAGSKEDAPAAHGEEDVNFLTSQKLEIKNMTMEQNEDELAEKEPQGLVDMQLADGVVPVERDLAEGAPKEGEQEAATSIVAPQTASFAAAQLITPNEEASPEPILSSATPLLGDPPISAPSDVSNTALSEDLKHDIEALVDGLRENKELFDAVSDELIKWKSKPARGKNGRILVLVIRTIFEKATLGYYTAEYYAQLVQKLMSNTSPNFKDDDVADSEGKSLAGSELFRKYILGRCEEEIERSWNSTDCRSQNRHCRFALIEFIGELFKVQVVTEPIMHKHITTILSPDYTASENRKAADEAVEVVCQLLEACGALLDTPTNCAQMEVHLLRLNKIGTMKVKLKTVVNLRKRGWIKKGKKGKN
ncbi:hypothetical protein HWV62_20850 [Athelia sp. TMB]|nr:hypothetical protein HWV62_20850 [Athelia sp. TMB]